MLSPHLCIGCAGLELYENVLSPDEQTNMIATVEDWVVQVRPAHIEFSTKFASHAAQHPSAALGPAAQE